MMTYRPLPQPSLSGVLNKWVGAAIEKQADIPLLMVSGAQGIGKTHVLTQLVQTSQYRIAVIGLDDVYHTHIARQKLAQTIHPLCETRGPPGSHDLPLLRNTITALKTAGPADATPLPRFDKPSDERLPAARWHKFKGRPDAILIEGWMIGALADETAPNAEPINAIEAQDEGGLWRAWQEGALAAHYASLWAMADETLHLCAPDFSAVLKWRLQQEESNLNIAPGSLPADRTDWVRQFIQHFERITRRMLNGHVVPGGRVVVDAHRNIVELPISLQPEA